jgi:ABC-type nitrate/sulfonate/bicarbonate transport system substrate-binding protein
MTQLIQMFTHPLARCLAIGLTATIAVSCAKKEAIQITLAESSLSVPCSLSFIAREKGFWKDQGLEVKVVSFAAGRLALDAMLNGQAQFATAAETPLATGAFRHNTYAIICEMMNTTTETKIIARRDAGITNPTDLRGKRVGVFVGTQAEYFMDAFFAHRGMNRSEVSVVNLQPPDQVIAIANRDIDALVVWQPHAFNALKRLGDNAVVFSNEGFYTSVFSMATLRDYAAKNPDVVEKFLRGLIEAEKFVRKNPDEAMKIVAKQVGIDPADLKEFYGEYQFVVKLSPVLLDALQKEGQWAINSGIVPQGSALPSYDEYLYPSALRRIDEGRVDLLAK